jgi:hypothetical protein
VAGEQGKSGANALQFEGQLGHWSPVTDPSPGGAPQDFPFLIKGERSTCAGDIDGDHATNQSDMGILLAAFGSAAGEPSYCLAADLDLDGDIGQADLGVFLANYDCVQTCQCKCMIWWLSGAGLTQCDGKGGGSSHWAIKIELENKGTTARKLAVMVFDNDGFFGGKTPLVDLGEMVCEPGKNTKVFEFDLHCDADCTVKGKLGDSNEEWAEILVQVFENGAVLCESEVDTVCMP